MEGAPRPPLIGRDEQLERMMARLAFALAGQGSAILISGEAGVGKSRLAEEFQALASHIDCLSIVTRCVASGASYQPFIDAFVQCASVLPGLKRNPQFARFIGDDPVSRPGKPSPSLPERSASVEGRSSEDPTNRLFDGLGLLREVAAWKPLVLRIDDLHLSDTRTIQMLHFMTRELHGMKALFVASFNDDELFDRSEAPHPLIDAVRIMKREGSCEEVYLSPLTRTELKAALEGMIGHRMSPSALNAIFDECGGNPRIAVELTREAVRDRTLRPSNGLMTLQSEDWMKIPPSLRAWIDKKLEVLAPAQKEILECAALLGDSFEVDAIATMLAQDRLSVLEKLETAVREHRIYLESSSNYSFRWGVVRHVALGAIPLPRRAELLGRLGKSPLMTSDRSE